MRRRALIACFSTALLLGLLASLPLRVALQAFDPAGAGLGAAGASGSLWSGTLHDARWRGYRLGDLNVGLRPWGLLARRMRLDDGHLRLDVVSGRHAGIEDASGVLDTPGPVDWPDLALQWTFDETTMVFADGHCFAAGGQVSLQLSSRLLPEPIALSGVPACRDRSLVLELAPLAGESWALHADLRLDPDGRYEARVTLRSHDPQMIAVLAAAGFQPGSSGPGRVFSGTIGP